MDLSGKVTPDGWQVCEAVEFSADHTGGNFSDCYFVTKNGQRAFLKALDIEKFDISHVSGLLAGFAYESDLLKFCQERGLGRIIKVLESGRIERDPTAPPVLRYVPFLIFELAQGDVRSSIDISTQVTNQWRFKVLHQTTLALLQLHRERIAHQDLKPSNVLIFDEKSLKLADLGRSSFQGKAAPHDGLKVAGARNYAPFEQKYDYILPDWIERRISVDVFHLGCFVVFSFTNICFPEYVIDRLAPQFHPHNWGDSYEKVIDHIKSASIQALADLSADFPSQFRSEIIEIVRDLCHPDPVQRGRSGFKGDSAAGLLWLNRYVSRFDILEKKSRVKQVAMHA